MADELGEPLAEAISVGISDVLESVIIAQETCQDNAELIAEAALEGERGREIARLSEGLDECRETLSLLPMMLGEQFRELIAASQTEMLLVMETHRASVAVPLVVEPSAIALPPTELAPPPLAIVEPETLPTPAPESAGESPAPQKRNRLV